MVSPFAGRSNMPTTVEFATPIIIALGVAAVCKYARTTTTAGYRTLVLWCSLCTLFYA